jgi:hypothetical protein
MVNNKLDPSLPEIAVQGTTPPKFKHRETQGYDSNVSAAVVATW